MIPKNTRDRVEKLKKTIEKYRHEYHVLNKSDISPEALDSLKHELSKLEEEYPELVTPDSPTQRVAGEPLKEFKKVVHKVPQWSFNDAFDEGEINDFDKRVKNFLVKAGISPDKVEYTCELKIDGLKIVYEYENGLLKTAATRGNGQVGEDVTLNVRTIESVPLKLKHPANVIVEGEVYLRKSQFERINRELSKSGEVTYANPRNVAAGTIRQLDPKIVAERKLSTFIYDLASVSKTPLRGNGLQGASLTLPTNQFEELKYLRDLGFAVNPHYQLAKNISDCRENDFQFNSHRPLDYQGTSIHYARRLQPQSYYGNSGGIAEPVTWPERLFPYRHSKAARFFVRGEFNLHPWR